MGVRGLNQQVLMLSRWPGAVFMMSGNLRTAWDFMLMWRVSEYGALGIVLNCGAL